jgi:hypothetical protein
MRRHGRAMEDFLIHDDLSPADAITEAELDAVEAFFLPILTRILEGEKRDEIS